MQEGNEEISAKLRDNFQFKHLLKLINLFGIFWVNLGAKTNSTLPALLQYTHSFHLRTKLVLQKCNLCLWFDVFGKVRSAVDVVYCPCGSQVVSNICVCSICWYTQAHPHPHTHTHTSAHRHSRRSSINANKWKHKYFQRFVVRANLFALARPK